MTQKELDDSKAIYGHYLRAYAKILSGLALEDEDFGNFTKIEVALAIALGAHDANCAKQCASPGPESLARFHEHMADMLAPPSAAK